MKSACAIVLATLLAACGGSQADRSDKDAFGQGFTAEWRNQNAAAARASAPATARPVDATKERQEFEAWLEWKRKNQK